jgi:hypothetical protein
MLRELLSDTSENWHLRQAAGLCVDVASQSIAAAGALGLAYLAASTEASGLGERVALVSAFVTCSLLGSKALEMSAVDAVEAVGELNMWRGVRQLSSLPG